MSIHAFTSITLNYLPKARVLARSLKRIHPEIIFHLLLAEATAADYLSDRDPFDEITLVTELGIEDLERWIFAHNVVEICTAVKGLYLNKILIRDNCEAVLYFDPDIVLLARLDALIARFDQGAILLTPHQLKPEEHLDAILDNEVCSLRHGVFNLGFLGVKRSAEGIEFARWWQRRLHAFCYSEIENGLFTDQKWVDLAPALFDGVIVVRDPVYNVATWNLSQRNVTGSFQEGFRVNGRPLAFYHFSGLDSGDQLTMLMKYGRGMPALFDLRNWYLRECINEGQLEFSNLMWQFARFDNEVVISPAQRRLYRDRQDLMAAFPNPFSTADIDHSYYHWYMANAE